METIVDIIVIVLLVLIVAAVMVIAFHRVSNLNYRMGKGMFENSEDNLDDPPEFSDKEYYDGGKGLYK